MRPLVAAALAITAVTVAAQNPTSFEVASVRENKSAGEAASMSGPRPGRFTTTNIPLGFIILDAFQLRAHELVGTPEWAWTARYDITAAYPADAVPERDWRPMLQRLLADRFGLVTHRETRDLPAYDLVLARQDGRLGPQLTRSDVNCEQWLAEKKPQIGGGGPSPVAPGGQRPACMLMTTKTFMTGGTRTIASLAGPLQSLSGRPVVDKTGLAGTFNVDMKWGEDGSVFTALQEQLGLKLEPSTAPFEVVVIDKLARPTPD